MPSPPCSRLPTACAWCPQEKKHDDGWMTVPCAQTAATAPPASSQAVGFSLHSCGFFLPHCRQPHEAILPRKVKGRQTCFMEEASAPLCLSKAAAPVSCTNIFVPEASCPLASVVLPLPYHTPNALHCFPCSEIPCALPRPVILGLFLLVPLWWRVAVCWGARSAR